MVSEHVSSAVLLPEIVRPWSGAFISAVVAGVVVERQMDTCPRGRAAGC